MRHPEVKPRRPRGTLGAVGDAIEVTIITTVTILVFTYLSLAYLVEKVIGSKRPKITS